jgi:hypothetical protein
VLESLSRGDYSQAARAAEIFLSSLSDLLNYTLNFKFVNVTFSLEDGFLNLRVNSEFIHEFSRFGANSITLCENSWAEAHTYPPVPAYFGTLDGGGRVGLSIGQVMA